MGLSTWRKRGLNRLTGDKLYLLNSVGSPGQYIWGWLFRQLMNQADPLRGCVMIKNLTIAA
jgi:hypothetical protein